jgi:protein-S-isoprenylcysteine O-methyltransferase Ste14
MVRLGNFFFKYRNGLFPVAFLLLFFRVGRILPDSLVAAGLGLVIAGSGQILRAATIGLAYIVRGGRNRKVYAEGLVTQGLFSHCRNPLYVGNMLILVGLGVASNSWVFPVIGFPFFILAYWAIIAAEENFLRGKYGAAFDEYCSHVPRIVPRLAGIGATLRSMEFNWKRLVDQEYGSAFYWIVGWIAVVIRNEVADRGYDGSRDLVRVLALAFIVAVIAWSTARFLKKTRRLETP